MNRLTRKIEYSLIALKHMASKRPGELTSVKEVADFYHTSFDVLARTLQALTQIGLLKAEMGASGGYQIVKDLFKVSMLELIQAVDGTSRMAKCFHEGDACAMKTTCNIVTPIRQLESKLNHFYKSLTIGEVLFERHEKRGSIRSAN